MNIETMRTQARGAELEFGGMTTAGELRRMLCDAKITPVVLNGESQPLDVGREKRCVTPAQRKAIAARDRGCAHPGCDRNPVWCQVHHIIHWLDGGRTDIDNLVMLCREHHRVIHDSGWKVRIRDVHPEFIPPKWIDLNQTPRRNARSLVSIS
jgi:5-methylcytosine-specific restriction protein A